VCTEQGELPLKAGVYQEGAVQNKGGGAGKSRKIKILQEAPKAMDRLKKAPDSALGTGIRPVSFPY
jgi:hypothetical protein